MTIINHCLMEVASIQTLAKIKNLTTTSIKKLPTPTLLDYHRKTHMLYSAAMKRNPPNKEFVNKVVDIHDLIVEDMIKRKIKHKTPLKKI